MRLRDLLAAFNEDLNDLNPAGTLPNRWSQAQLLRFFNEGLCNVFTLNPNEFVEASMVKLDPGTLQKLCDCKVLRKILGQTDETGLVLTPVPEQNISILSRWTKKVCLTPTNGEFTLTGYTYSAGDNGYFNVYPPIPPNEDVYLKVLCANPPEPYTMKDLDKEVDAGCASVTAARQWVLYSALMIDDEVEIAVAAARVHLETFFNILKVQLTQQRLAELGVNRTVRATNDNG
ncbi:hypothetical protein V757_11210 [Pelistega indica]|uniref:Uncharacterized protein n=1 Tax=Pelistega indica TaxID=1414851 RepID=V8FTU2_9BURK|nr:DUF6682 family protein [Pelistega indica]ETD67550.1 hypothetical protein V757_11210 [Pelistega indica]